ncbi:methionyl-tRNA formyltransferase [Pelagibacterales bacterium SAG-MED13]|nr:methionyl-tRNA formyltransferase [Pelagibacterales bacterium SAG-MED13]
MPQKIIFMGTPLFAVPILKSLYQNGFPISVVYTQPPQKSHRGQKINKSPIQGISETLNIDFRCPENLKDNDKEYEFIKNLNADLAIVVAYGKIIPENFLNLTNKGFINIHGSILPKWRGAAPIQRSIMNLDKETGISIMKLVKKLDSGPVSNIYKIKLNQNDNAEEISEKLSLLAAEKILDDVDNILQNKAKFIDQEHSKASYAKKIEKIEGQINWNDETLKIIAKINGLFPVPGAYFNFKGERYKILKAEIGNGIGQTGEVLSDKLEIACANNKSIKILEIQRQGKKPQKIGEFMLGSHIRKGALLSNA